MLFLAYGLYWPLLCWRNETGLGEMRPAIAQALRSTRESATSQMVTLSRSCHRNNGGHPHSHISSFAVRSPKLLPVFLKNLRDNTGY